MSQQINYRAAAKFAIVWFLALFLLIGIAVALVFIVETGPRRSMLEAYEKQTIYLQRSYIVGDIGSINSDLMFLAGLQEVGELFLQERSLDPVAREDLNKKFLLFARTQKLYNQIRLLDETGMEIVRVNYDSGSPAVVPESELQNKKGRYYFDDTFRLARREVYVSPLDLNIERGEIEQPHKPMIRFGTPIFDVRGRKRGGLFLNYLAANLLGKFTDTGSAAASRSMLLNSDGYYLKGPSPDDEWGFMFKDREDRRFGKAYANEWQRIEAHHSGQFETAGGLFTFTTVYPLLLGQKSSRGSGEPYGSGGEMLGGEEYKWRIVLHMPADVLYAERNAFRLRIVMFMTIVAVILGIVSWRLACAYVAPQRAAEDLRKACD